MFSDIINQHIGFLSQNEEKLREEDIIPSSENSHKYFVNLIDLDYDLNPKFKVFSFLKNQMMMKYLKKRK